MSGEMPNAKSIGSLGECPKRRKCLMSSVVSMNDFVEVLLPVMLLFCGQRSKHGQQGAVETLDMSISL